MADPAPHIAVLPDLLRAQAAVRPTEPAVIHDGERVLTYGEWEDRSNAMARGLAARGVQRGDVVALVFDNAHVIDWAIADFAVQKAGATSVTRNPDVSATPETVDRLRKIGACCVVSPEDLMPAGAPGWAATPIELEAGRDTAVFQAPTSAQDVATILYTSGSDGWAKAVAVPHANITALPDVLQSLGSPPSPGVLYTGLVSQASAHLMIVRPLLPMGPPTVSISDFDPERVCAVLARMGLRAIALAPHLARLLLESGAPGRFDLSRMSAIRLRIAPSTPALIEELAEAFPGAGIYNHYTSTEAAPAATEMLYGRDPAHTVGLPGMMTELRVIDPNGVVITEHGAVGEICLRCRHGAYRWYFGDPDRTAEWMPDGFARMRDFGYIDDAGYVVLVDRFSDAFSVDGNLVEALRVEGVLAQHPAVVEAAVVGVRPAGSDSGWVPVAAVVARRPVPEEELLAFAAARLPASEVPRAARLYDRLPRRITGKVDKAALRTELGGAGHPQPQVFRV